MKRDEYLKMLYQDNETEKEPKKELYTAVLECTVEALSQTPDCTEVDQSVGLDALYKIIEEAGRASRVVSPFRAAELIAKKLGVEYKRPIERFAHLFRSVGQQQAVYRLEDLL